MLDVLSVVSGTAPPTSPAWKAPSASIEPTVNVPKSPDKVAVPEFSVSSSVSAVIEKPAVAVMPLANTSEEATDRRESVSIAPVFLYLEVKVPEMVASACAATGRVAAIARAIRVLFIEIPLQ